MAMAWRTVGAWITAAAVLGGAAAAAPVDSTRAIDSLRRKHDLPALAVLVIKDGKVCDRVVTGVRKVGDAARVTTNDLWHIGSCTKPMTATLAALLIEEGKLHWDTTVADVFPELKGRIDKAYEGVTLEQWLRHRGGTSGEPPGKAWGAVLLDQGPITQQRYAFIQTLLAEKPAAPPGTKYIYSNQGYVVAGAMLEKLTGKSWEALMQEKLFQPLGMKSAGFGAPGTPGQSDQPWGHTRLLWKQVPLQQDNPAANGPAGAVHCSLEDLARFVMLHLERGAGGKGLLTPETIRRLHTPPADGNYACGWEIAERDWAGGRALTHNGSNTLWYLVIWLAPDRRFAVLVATNSGGDNAANGCDAAAGAMVKAWLGK